MFFLSLSLKPLGWERDNPYRTVWNMILTNSDPYQESLWASPRSEKKLRKTEQEQRQTPLTRMMRDGNSATLNFETKFFVFVKWTEIQLSKLIASVWLNPLVTLPPRSVAVFRDPQSFQAWERNRPRRKGARIGCWVSKVLKCGFSESCFYLFELLGYTKSTTFTDVILPWKSLWKMLSIMACDHP